MGRSGQRRYIDAAGYCCNERLLFTWKLDGGVMVLDSQRPAIGSPISDGDKVSAAKVSAVNTLGFAVVLFFEVPSLDKGSISYDP
jgi:hypothetical protein